MLKQQLVLSIQNDDVLCCARVICVTKAWLHKDDSRDTKRHYHKINYREAYQARIAWKLHEEAGVPGLNPTVQSYDRDNMRTHYINCLNTHNMVPFPRTSRRVPYHAINKRKAVTIYCVCRMPYDKESLNVECCQCKHWYQPTCVTIPAWAINTNRKWRCNKCRSLPTTKANLHTLDS